MSQLGSDDVGGLWALLAVLDVERDSLSFLERIELAVRGRKMEEDIRTFGLSDETETLFGLFLDCARRHKKSGKKKSWRRCKRFFLQKDSATTHRIHSSPYICN